MRQIIKPKYLLLLLFLFVLAFRLFFAFQTDHFNTDSAYFHFRHIQYLTEEKTLLNYDNLSYGGREILYPPLFHIIMALLSFGSVFMLKLIPEIIISLTVFIVYIIAKDVSGSEYAAVGSALLASFYPILFTETLNNLSVYAFVIPILLIMIYSLVRLEEKKYLWAFIICSFILPLIHPSAFIFVVTIVLYFFLLAGGALNPTRIKKEAAIFSVLLIILFEFIIYKKAFLEYGTSLLWQNVPVNILSDSFRKLSITELLVGVGILPLILGIIGIYIGMIRDRMKVAYMFAAFAITILLLLVLRFLTISTGLMYLGIVLSIFSASSLNTIYKYLNKLKFSYFKKIFVILFVILFLFSSLFTSFLATSESSEIAKSKIKEVRWFTFNTPGDAVILGNIGEGNLISTIGNRTNVLDTNFLLAPDPIERSRDVDIMYTTVSEAIALSLIKKYNIRVIYLSDETKDGYGISYLKYANSSRCFESVRDGRYYVVQC